MDNHVASEPSLLKFTQEFCVRLFKVAKSSNVTLFVIVVALCVFAPPKILSFFPSKLENKATSFHLHDIPTIRLKPGSTLPASELYFPTENNNFYFSAWFRLKELPSDGDSYGIFEKVDMQRRNRNGYALTLKRYGEELRPEVYWRNDEGRGKVYTFAPVEILPGNWTLLLLSFRKNNELNISAGISIDGELIEPKNLGGYVFEFPPLLPESANPVRLTNSVGQRFKGEFGPIGIYSGGSSHTQIAKIMDEILSDPLSPPKTFKKSAIKFWIP